MKIFHITVIAIIGYALAGAIGLGTLNLMTENNSLQNEIETLRSDSNLLDQQIEITQINLDELSQNYSILSSLHESISNDLELKLQKNTQLSIDNDKWMTQTIELQNDHNTLILDHEALITDYSFLNKTSNQQNIDINQSQETNRLLNIQLNESNIKLDNLKEKNSQIETENTELQLTLSLQQTEIDDAMAIIDEFRDETNAPNIDLVTLTHQYNELVDDYNTLVDTYNMLHDDYISLLDTYDALKATYDLWRLHADLAPKNRIEYDVLGYIPYAGEWLIEESAILISFLDPENCVMLGNIAFTGSMRPAMHGGHTTIETTCFSNSDLQLGDIISYVNHEEDIAIIHQIIEIRPEGVIAKDINNEVADPGVILWDDIISLVIAIVY
jgi:hypothetical protein